MYVHGIEIDAINQQLNKKEISDGQYNVIEFTDIEGNGEKPIDGMVEILEGKVIDYSLKIGNYIVNYDKENNKPVISEDLRKAVPVVELVEGMIPVQYKNNKWIMADASKKDWYNYNKQEWANAVILNAGITKNIGDTIDIANEVKGMFVYIPRYEYKIEGQYGKGGTSTSTPGEIEINFITKEITTGSKGYRVHPGFTFGSEELNGIWVGKFETTGTGEDPTILPSVTSLRNQNISTQFTTAQKFNEFLTNGDSHMAKNSEWGAVAYLSQSKYGKYGNSNYSGTEKEVMINNCSNKITGIGENTRNDIPSTETCTTNTYETINGQMASTTGNITGIYDMRGGTWEYVMANYNKTSGKSGINFETLDSKYYDLYTSQDLEAACNGEICYGHALSETASWYGDAIYFIGPWFDRGGRYSSGNSSTGIFNITSNQGGASTEVTFRIVILKG